jgi:signal transduction histidine kinase
LVIGPTIALGAYGLSGIENARVAAEAERRARYEEQARDIEAEVLRRLAEEDARLRQRIQGTNAEGAVQLLAAEGKRPGPIRRAWRVNDEGCPAGAAEAAAGLTPEAPVTFLPPEESRRDTVAVSRIGPDLAIAYAIDPLAVDALLVPEIVAGRYARESAAYHLRAVVPEPAGAPMSFERLRSEMAERLVQEEPTVDVAMSPPFSGWHVVVEDRPPDTGGSGTWWVVVFLVLAASTGGALLGRAVLQQLRLSRLQTDFVSNVSHELRTPLTSIRMFVETLQDGRVSDPEKVRECLDIVAAETERLSRKIERVLGWARMEAGRRVFQVEECSPVDLVGRALAAFRAQDLQSETPVTVDVPGDLPRVQADPEAIAEALLNLLGNARKYGGENVRVKVTGRADPRWVSLVVADDGPGIPLHERVRIFDKFYRADSLLSRRTEGSGLGLSIVRAIVQAHGGKVDVDSEEGKGARFTVRLRRG